MHRGAPEGACPEQTVNTNHSHASFSATAVVCASLLAAVSFVHAQSPEVLAKRQCRSVHIRQDGHPAQAAALYNEVKARTSVPGTYFCAMNFDDGYIGFQEQSNGRKVIIFPSGTRFPTETTPTASRKKNAPSC